MSPLQDWLSFRESPLPVAAVELAANRVSAVALEKRGDRAIVTGHATEGLPQGAVTASLTSQNVRDRAVVTRALASVLEQVGGPRRIGLIVPDPVAKVSLMKFEQVPARRQDLDQLIRWQMRKTAPFPIEEAQVSYVEGARASDGQEFVVSVARREVIQELESLCAEAGAHAGVVDIATLNIINGLLARRSLPGGDWLLINAAPDYASIAILRGADPIFFRSRGDSAEGGLSDLVHQSVMYYEDRLQGTGFSRVVLSGVAEATKDPAEVDQMRRSLEGRLRVPIERADLRGVVQLTDRAEASPALQELMTPLVGLLLRDHA